MHENELELWKEGIIKLSDALSLFMKMESFSGENITGAIYIALHYAEELTEIATEGKRHG